MIRLIRLHNIVPSSQALLIFHPRQHFRKVPYLVNRSLHPQAVPSIPSKTAQKATTNNQQPSSENVKELFSNIEANLTSLSHAPDQLQMPLSFEKLIKAVEAGWWRLPKQSISSLNSKNCLIKYSTILTKNLSFVNKVIFLNHINTFLNEQNRLKLAKQLFQQLLECSDKKQMALPSLVSISKLLEMIFQVVKPEKFLKDQRNLLVYQAIISHKSFKQEKNIHTDYIINAYFQIIRQKDTKDLKDLEQKLKNYEITQIRSLYYCYENDVNVSRNLIEGIRKGLFQLCCSDGKKFLSYAAMVGHLYCTKQTRTDNTEINDNLLREEYRNIGLVLDKPIFAFGFEWIIDQLASFNEAKQSKFVEILYYYDLKLEQKPLNFQLKMLKIYYSIENICLNRLKKTILIKQPLRKRILQDSNYIKCLHRMLTNKAIPSSDIPAHNLAVFNFLARRIANKVHLNLIGQTLKAIEASKHFSTHQYIKIQLEHLNKAKLKGYPVLQSIINHINLKFERIYGKLRKNSAQNVNVEEEKQQKGGKKEENPKKENKVVEQKNIEDVVLLNKDSEKADNSQKKGAVKTEKESKLESKNSSLKQKAIVQQKQKMKDVQISTPVPITISKPLTASLPQKLQQTRIPSQIQRDLQQSKFNAINTQILKLGLQLSKGVKKQKQLLALLKTSCETTDIDISYSKKLLKTYLSIITEHLNSLSILFHLTFFEKMDVFRSQVILQNEYISALINLIFSIQQRQKTINFQEILQLFLSIYHSEYNYMLVLNEKFSTFLSKNIDFLNERIYYNSITENEKYELAILQTISIKSLGLKYYEKIELIGQWNPLIIEFLKLEGIRYETTDQKRIPIPEVILKRSKDKIIRIINAIQKVCKIQKRIYHPIDFPIYHILNKYVVFESLSLSKQYICMALLEGYHDINKKDVIFIGNDVQYETHLLFKELKEKHEPFNQLLTDNEKLGNIIHNYLQIDYSGSISH